MLTRDAYVTKMKSQLDEWSAETEALEEKVRRTSEDAPRAKHQAQLEALHARRLEGEKRLDTIKAAIGDSWGHLRAETENVWEGLRDSVDAFKAHFEGLRPSAGPRRT